MKKFTIIIIPPGSTKMKKLRLGKIPFFMLVLFLLLVITYSVWLAFNFSSYVYQKEKNEQLSARYDTLVKERKKDKQKLKKIKKELSQLENMMGKISNIMGVKIDKEVNNKKDYYQSYEKKWIGEKLKEYNYVTRDSYMNLSAPKFIPVSGWISSRFGTRKSPYTSKNEFHPAVDIIAPMGRTIRAAASGKVVNIKEDPTMGKVLYIYNKWGYLTKYAHNNKIFVNIGDKVEIGDKIAEVGVSGKTTGPHLHFQMELLRIPVDPEKYGMELSDKRIFEKSGGNE
ncbi:MAG: M23 family metallopeptidase [Candidatus Mcinerneyibacterium aminivorans]|uniref:M23 family metallopeptidase n=1 Tax=Candidatus Mcinerneyibacterium aminivorans TaxID=2703815 RepID=A0A5D0MEU7_9BACT|nr:MAG: M23 family metallopeptidase [Candidatus Mcinerneyibacterium aminivorans]